MSKKKKKGKQKQWAKFPAATLAFYGPDDKHATKAVVSIVPDENSDPTHLRRWMSDTTDVRMDENIGNEIAAFIKEHGVKQVISYDRIIGCPHEEGIDYPEGMKCPKCTFWVTRNRFTHEGDN